jgi:hypothetical protein
MLQIKVVEQLWRPFHVYFHDVVSFEQAGATKS